MASQLKTASKKALKSPPKHLPVASGADSGQVHFQRALSTLDFMHEEVLLRNTSMKVEKNREGTIVCGILQKRTAKWIGMGTFGMWWKNWSERWVELDPANGILSYRRPLSDSARRDNVVQSSVSSLSMPSVGGRKAPMTKRFALENVLWMQTQRSALTIQLMFCHEAERRKIERVLHLKAGSNQDFDRWVESLSCYGIGCGGQTPKTPTAHPTACL